MRKKHTTIFLGLFITLFIQSYSQNKIVPDFATLITNRFSKQWINTPQEKVYLQTDKPYYSAGEEIWFKGYLVNATTLKPTAYSKFMYVELISKLDSVIYRIKIKKDSLGFAGHIRLKPEIPSGNYSLRAYTYWMQNTPEEFFFSKNILIGNGIDNRINSNITYGMPVNGLVPVTIAFTNASHNPVSGKRVDVAQNWTSALKKKSGLVTNNEGKIKLVISVDENDNSKKNLEVSMDDQK